MATVNILPTRITARIVVGTDENGNPIYRNRSFSNVNPAITDDDAYEVFSTLLSLQAHPVAAIRRVDVSELSE